MEQKITKAPVKRGLILVEYEHSPATSIAHVYKSVQTGHDEYQHPILVWISIDRLEAETMPLLWKKIAFKYPEADNA